MRLSQLFTHTLRDDPKDEVTANARLLIRGGFIFKNLAGVYSFLPLGWRIVRKIEQIIREEMEAIGGQELHLNILQDKQVWETTKRWAEAKEVMYQFKTLVDREEERSGVKGQEIGLGFTHEEVVAQIASQYIHSYRDLPKYVYQIQTKFRNEPRAQAGILRGKEFDMKDLYSLTATEEQLNEFYERCAEAYFKIFHRLGLSVIRVKASGGLFSKFSDEFQVITAVGEDTIYICSRCGFSFNKEIIDPSQIKPRQLAKTRSPLANKAQISNIHCQKCDGETTEHRSIEVGNIFKLGSRFSEPFGLYFTDQDGVRRPVIMGSYGIGVGRAMGTVVEVHHDDKGILWPEEIAPYKVHLVEIRHSSFKLQNKSPIQNPKQASEKIYRQLMAAGVEVLYDDRENVSAGVKFADADLIGCPIRLVVSEKTIERRSVEIKKRDSSSPEIVGLSRVIRKLAN